MLYLQAREDVVTGKDGDAGGCRGAVGGSPADDGGHCM